MSHSRRREGRSHLTRIFIDCQRAIEPYIETQLILTNKALVSFPVGGDAAMPTENAFLIDGVAYDGHMGARAFVDLSSVLDSQGSGIRRRNVRYCLPYPQSLVGKDGAVYGNDSPSDSVVHELEELDLPTEVASHEACIARLQERHYARHRLLEVPVVQEIILEPHKRVISPDGERAL